MKMILSIILLLFSTVTLAQEGVPVIPVINYQFSISEPASGTRVGERSTSFGGVLDSEGDLLVIGAYNEQNQIDTNRYYGAVYIYRNIEDEWILEQKIINPLSTSFLFGISVKINNGRVAVGSPGVGVYIYTYTGTWEPNNIVPAPDETHKQFAHEITLRGNVLAVSDVYGDSGGRSEGTVYVYRETIGVWGLEQALKGDLDHDGDITATFGSAIDISDDGSIIAVGEPEHPSNYLLGYPGAAYVFRFDGIQWQLEKTLEGAPAFGASIDLLGDGVNALLAVGDTGIVSIDTGVGVSGKVHIFGSSLEWQQINEFTDPTETKYDFFGLSVNLVGTPQNAVVIVAMIPQREELYAPIPPARLYAFNIGDGTQIMEIISPSDADFDDDGKQDYDGFGRTVDIEGNSTSLKIFVGAQGLFIGDAKTFIFSHNPTPEEMVNSGDFETSGNRDVILNAWERSPGAKLKCLDKGNDSPCAIKFASGIGSRVWQNVDLSQIPLFPGDSVLFQADTLVKGESILKMKLKVIYSDGFKAVVTLKVGNTGGVYRRVMSAPGVFIANRPLAKIQIKVSHNYLPGAAFLDNVSLVRVAGSTAR